MIDLPQSSVPIFSGNAQSSSDVGIVVVVVVDVVVVVVVLREYKPYLILYTKLLAQRDFCKE